ncbi:hypothetical protein JKY72_06800 [Candidatus Gracilibacteria bacterium]|nr:hypothetical protein [Candidatus Gracilibacteria bacterium]
MFKKLESINPGPCLGVNDPIKIGEPVDYKIPPQPLKPDEATYPTVLVKGLEIVGIRGCIYANSGRGKDATVTCMAGIKDQDTPLTDSQRLPACLQTRTAVSNTVDISSLWSKMKGNVIPQR